EVGGGLGASLQRAGVRAQRQSRYGLRRFAESREPGHRGYRPGSRNRTPGSEHTSHAHLRSGGSSVQLSPPCTQSTPRFTLEPTGRSSVDEKRLSRVRWYLVRKAVAFVATLLVVSLLVFIVIRVLPGDPAQVIMGTEGNPEATARLRHSLGLDRPLVVQYVHWLTSALHGDLGVSIQYDVPVGRLIVSRLPVTLPLTLLAALFMIATAIPLGLYAATHQRRLGDYVTMIVSQLGISVPSFWAGLLLILLFSVHLGWLQSGGFTGW